MSNHIIYSRYFKLGEYFHLVKCVMEKYGIPISDQRSLICIMRGALSKNLTKSFNEISSRNKSQNESGNQISNNRNVDNDQEYLYIYFLIKNLIF